MTPASFKSVREKLGLTQSEMAQVLRLNSGRAVRAYESGDRKISGPISRLIEIFLRHPRLAAASFAGSPRRRGHLRVRPRLEGNPDSEGKP
jgi:transcriptional regulator with XRE-family HTH domain